jgi:hypothetical protein
VAATLAYEASPAVPAVRRSRIVIAGPAGLALLLAGGALLVRVAVMTAAGQGAAQNTWLFTAAACVLAGLALAIIAVPRLAPSEHREADKPDPAEPRG